MIIQYILENTISEKYRDQIYKMIEDADTEFVPHLSKRSSTTQQVLSDDDPEEGESKERGGTGSIVFDRKSDFKKKADVSSYYENVLRQSAILAIDEEDRVCGFMSFIPHHDVEMGSSNKLEDVLYLSTLIVDKKMRRMGISRRMYETLFASFPDRRIVTRTWSTNDGHLPLLKRLGFQLLEVIPNDRGEGIDTVYYGKM